MDIILYNKIEGNGFNKDYLNHIMISLGHVNVRGYSYQHIKYRENNLHEILLSQQVSPDFNKRLCTVLSRKSL